MKSKLLPVLLIALILLNGALIFMLINKTNKTPKEHPKRNFLTEQLQFSKEQKNQFMILDEAHRKSMRGFDKLINQQKEVLFNSFQVENFNIDSLTTKIGVLEGKKESEVYNFFKKVREICTKEQTDKFDEIIKKALKGRKPGPPRDGRKPPHKEGMPPPPR